MGHITKWGIKQILIKHAPPKTASPGNLPETFQGTSGKRFFPSGTAANRSTTLFDALETIYDALETLHDALGRLDDALETLYGAL